MIRLFSLFLVLALVGPVSAIAQEPDDTAGTTVKQSVRQLVKAKREAAKTALDEYKNAREDQKLAKLKSYGLRLIEHRLDAIQRQSSLVGRSKCKNIEAEIQAAIKTRLGGIEATLNAQKTTLNAATTVDEAKTIVQGIIKDNRVFIFLLPASNGACLAQRLIALLDGRLTEAVKKLQAVGLDTTAIESKMLTAKTDAKAAYELYIEVLKKSGNNDEANKTKLAQAKTLLQKVRKALGDIKSDIGNLTGEYRQKTSDSNITP